MGSTRRYTAVAITLHWVIAAFIVANTGLGVWMSWAIDSPAVRAHAVNAFQWHKSLGLAVLVLSLLRLAWRLLYPPPSPPPHMSGWERTLAALTHWVFYALMIIIPLSGWLYVSAQWRGDGPFNIPTLWFGLFEVPHLFGLSDASRALRQQAAALAFGAHGAMALALSILLVLHVAAALKHQFVQRDGVLARMLPSRASPGQLAVTVVSPKPSARNMAAAGLTLLVAVLLIAYATTIRLAPEPVTPATGKATVLEALVTDHGTEVQPWQLIADSSHIRFAGEHAGRDFNGHFGEWRAALHIDPQAPQQSFLAAVVATGSATTGVSLHDRSLPQGEWFDVASHPNATFSSTAIESLGDNRYAVEGVLTIKNNPVVLAPLILTIDGDTLHLTGKLELDRAAVDLGMESDPEGDYVSREVEVRIAVDAVAPGYPAS